MPTRILLLSGWFFLGIAFVDAVPDRQPHGPAPVSPSSPPVFDLAGSSWRGTVYLPDCSIVFHADGTLTYNAPNGSHGKWQLIGNLLKFDINDYSHYELTVMGDEMKGTGKNQAGMTCTPHLKRVFDPPPGPPP